MKKMVVKAMEENDRANKCNVVGEVDVRMVAGIPATTMLLGTVHLVHSVVVVVSEDVVDSVVEGVVAAEVDVVAAVEERTTMEIKPRAKRSILLVKKAKQEKALKMARPAYRNMATF